MNQLTEIMWTYYRKFPSPIGELHFSIVFEELHRRILEDVSVPYRGATFLNKKEAPVWNDSCYVFPSPIGELHFSINL